MPNIHELVIQSSHQHITEELKCLIKRKIVENLEKYEQQLICKLPTNPLHPLETRDAKDMTALMHARKIEIVELLLKYGADVNAISSYRSGNLIIKTSVLYHLTNYQGSGNWIENHPTNGQKILQALLDKGADPNYGKVVITYKDNIQISEERISIFAKVINKVNDIGLIKSLIKAGGDIKPDIDKLLEGFASVFRSRFISPITYSLICMNIDELIHHGISLSKEQIDKFKNDVEMHLNAYQTIVKNSAKAIIERDKFISSDKNTFKRLIEKYEAIKLDFLKFNEDIEKAMWEYRSVKFKKNTLVTEKISKDLYRDLYQQNVNPKSGAEVGLPREMVDKIKMHMSDTELSEKDMQTQIDFANTSKGKQGKNFQEYLKNLRKYKSQIGNAR